MLMSSCLTTCPLPAGACCCMQPSCRSARPSDASLSGVQHMVQPHSEAESLASISCISRVFATALPRNLVMCYCGWAAEQLAAVAAQVAGRTARGYNLL